MDFLKVFKLIPVFFVLSMLASCGSSGGGDSSAATTGRVSLLITDGVTEDFDEVNLTVTSISFLGEDDGHETIVFDESRVINLLALQNYSDLLVTAVIAVGTYDKIRLYVTKVELVKEGQEPIITKLPANGKVDLNPRGTFEVTGDGHLMIELDVDAEKSIHIVKTGNGIKYNFRPVVFVNILEEELKLVILDGKVLAKTETGFQLCDIEVMEADDSCLAVLLSGDTVVQNYLIAEGSIEDNNIATVLGKMSSASVNALHIVIASDNSEEQNLALFKGKATSAVVANSFGMTTDDCELLLTTLTVSLDGYGARVFNKYGEVVDAGEIIECTDVDVFGLAQPDLDSVTDIKAAFVIIDNSIDNRAISGTIVEKVDNIITVDIGDEIISIFECVDVVDAEMILLSIDEEDGIILSDITVSDLDIGMSVRVYGENDGSCIAADFVVAITP